MTRFLSKKIVFLICGSLAFLSCGCSPIISKEIGTTQESVENNLTVNIITVTSEKDLDALNDAARKAVRFCIAQKKSTNIISQNVKYIGLTDAQKQLVYKANREFGANNNVNSNRDYEVTLKFTCFEKDV